MSNFRVTTAEGPTKYSKEETARRIDKAITLLREKPESFILITRKGDLNKCESALEVRHLKPLCDGMTFLRLKMTKALNEN